MAHSEVKCGTCSSICSMSSALAASCPVCGVFVESGRTHPAELHEKDAQATKNESQKKELQESGTCFCTERFGDVQDKGTNGQCVLCLCLDSGFGFRSWVQRSQLGNSVIARLRLCKCGKALSLPGSIHVVILPFDTDPHRLVDPLLLWGQGIDLVGLPEVGAARGRHVLGELRSRAVRGVKQGLVVAHHRQSLLGRDRSSP